MVIDYVFYKIINIYKGSLTKKNTLEIFICLYLCTSIGWITEAFYLKISGQKEQGGIIRVVSVVDMVLNFFITDKSIMAERSSVPSHVSKCSTTSAFL